MNRPLAVRIDGKAAALRLRAEVARQAAALKAAHGVVPGSNARIELIEFRGVPSTPFDLRVPDPGASGMAIRVAAIDRLLPKLDAAGARIISKDRKLVEWSATVRNVFVKDPNGFNLELVGEAPK